jgi:hypothetical protein
MGVEGKEMDLALARLRAASLSGAPEDRASRVEAAEAQIRKLAEPKPNRKQRRRAAAMKGKR